MRIVVRSDEHKICFDIPTGLALNRLTAAAVPKMMEKNGLTVTYPQALAFIKGVKAYKRQHPEWCLVEVQSADGEYVMIQL